MCWAPKQYSHVGILIHAVNRKIKKIVREDNCCCRCWGHKRDEPDHRTRHSRPFHIFTTSSELLVSRKKKVRQKASQERILDNFNSFVFFLTIVDISTRHTEERMRDEKNQIKLGVDIFQLFFSYELSDSMTRSDAVSVRMH